MQNLVTLVRIIQNPVTPDQAIVLHPGQVHHPLLKVEGLKDNYENKSIFYFAWHLHFSTSKCPGYL